MRRAHKVCCGNRIESGCSNPFSLAVPTGDSVLTAMVHELRTCTFLLVVKGSPPLCRKFPSRRERLLCWCKELRVDSRAQTTVSRKIALGKEALYSIGIHLKSEGPTNGAIPLYITDCEFSNRIGHFPTQHITLSMWRCGGVHCTSPNVNNVNGVSVFCSFFLSRNLSTVSVMIPNLFCTCALITFPPSATKTKHTQPIRTRRGTRASSQRKKKETLRVPVFLTQSGTSGKLRLRRDTNTKKNKKKNTE